MTVESSFETVGSQAELGNQRIPKQSLGTRECECLMSNAGEFSDHENYCLDATARFGADWDVVRNELEQAARFLDSTEAWPESQFELLSRAGVLGWVIPVEYGGTDVSPLDLTIGYEDLAAACLTTTFVLTQRNGACQRIAGSDNEDLKRRLLPSLCAGDAFATVGISHFTTSRQHLAEPAVRVRLTDSGVVLDGTVPWVTGANRADWIVTGGTCDDGRQVLLALPASSAGVEPQPPPRMMALNGSQTSSVKLTNVEVDAGMLLAGPTENVMKRGRGGGAGSFATSALAVGSAAGILKKLYREAELRPDLVPIHAVLETERSELSTELRQTVARETMGVSLLSAAESIRQRANSLVLRASQSYLAASKGAGFVAGHPAERAVREAMFFLVWSCPQPVLAAALREFACGLD